MEWIWLSKIPKVGAIRKQQLLKYYKNPKEIWNAKKEDLIKIKGIGEESANQILKQEYRRNLQAEVQYLRENKIEFIGIQDERYPKRLKQIYDYPIGFYMRGNQELLDQKALAIIGCRANTTYGEKVTRQLTKELVSHGFTIISGLARGIDRIAHEETIKSNGKTIAILGNGLDRMYPEENKELAREILKKGGALISEYPIGTKPEKMNFPARNRIISGMASGIVVIEAKKKSGTMITVDFALEQGKDIFAIPGNITSPNAEGTNLLLKEGAKIVTQVEDILEELKEK